jgi:Rha family phage regulatory protein
MWQGSVRPPFFVSNPNHMEANVLTFTPTLAVIDGRPVVQSVAVAEHFQKQHKDVLRRIENLLIDLPEEHKRNFAPMFVTVEIGKGAVRQSPAYHLTRDGFTLLAMGFTGRKALAWKLRYIDAFNAMEAELAARREAEATDDVFLRRLARLTPEIRAGLMRLAQRIEGRGAQLDAVMRCYRGLVEEITVDMPAGEAVALPGDAPWTAEVEQFLAERCAVAPGLSVPAGKLYAAFEAWAREKGFAASPSSIAFGRVLRRRFRQHKANVYHWQGLALAETAAAAASVAAKGVMQ